MSIRYENLWEIWVCSHILNFDGSGTISKRLKKCTICQARVVNIIIPKIIWSLAIFSQPEASDAVFQKEYVMFSSTKKTVIFCWAHAKGL